MDGDKVYGLCSLCGGTLLSDHDCIAYRKVLGLPPSVDWHAVARDAAVRIAADNNGEEVSKDWFERYSAYCCDLALALVAEMKKHDGFGGGP